MKKLKPMRILVTGGRLTTLAKLGIDPGAVHALVVKTLNVISAGGRRHITLIHGGADGVDAFSNSWAVNTKTEREVYPITKEDWAQLGNRAGPERNAFMLTKQPDVVLSFPGGDGTFDMVAQAQAKGVRVVEMKL